MIIRWISEDGKRKWLYPIKKDIYTKGEIKKQISHKSKVIGITKVNIPSPMHPKIPYNILLLEDEHGNRMPKKTMKEYSIGDTYEIKPATTDGAVVVTKIKYDIDEYLKQSLDLIKDLNIKEGDKVLIVPSAIEPAYGYQAVTTNPAVIESLIIYLKEKKITDIVVGCQAMIGNDVMASLKKSGIQSVCKKHEIEVKDLGQGEFVEKSHEDMSFSVSKDIYERKVINVPVMKTHSQLGIAGAMENMTRVVDKKTQIAMFSQGIHQSMAKLFKVLPEIINIGDATIGLHANGPTLLGEPAFLNMVFVSKDPVAMDSIFYRMGSLEKPDYISHAAELQVGKDNPKEIEIVGDELEAIIFSLKPAKLETAHPNIEIIDGQANPAVFNMVLQGSAKLFGILGHKMHLAIGKQLSKEQFIGKDRVVACGSEAINAMKELGITPITEIDESMDKVEQIMLIKSILEDPDKKGVNALDKVKSKMAKFGLKIKKAMS